MTTLKRVGFFSIGFTMGIIILVVILSGKKTSCSYFPNARTLKDISRKHRIYSEEALKFFQQNNIDTSMVSKILEDGNVDFGKSQTHTKPCKTYYITGGKKKGLLELKIEKCDSTATIETVQFFNR